MITASRPTALELGRVLAHPVWLTSLALLLVNDHLLKGSGLLPGWLTGKASDFAGMLVAPVLLGVLVRGRTRLSLLLVHVVVGVGFTAFELSHELAAAADLGYGAFGWTWRQWSDPTDLLALFCLPISYHFAVRVAGASPPLPRGRVTRALASAGLLASAASTGEPVNVGPEDGVLAPDCSESEGGTDPNTGLPFPCEASVTEDACDDGIDDDTDGRTDCQDDDCAASCAALVDACSALAPLHIATPTSLSGSTAGRVSATETECLGADSPDAFFMVVVDEPGTFLLEIPENHGLSVRTTCADWRSELSCAAVAGPVSVGVESPGNYYVVVEAVDPLAAGAFEIPVAFRILTCGDGHQDLDEACDDGNGEGGDGCSATCTLE